MNKDQEILNRIYDQSLAFGKNYRRPIKDILNESFPELSETDKKELEEYITNVRASIEKWIFDQSENKNLLLQELLSFRAQLWIKKNYPWMNQDNISHAISQAIYFTKF
jgi:hypothetical protein